MVIQHKSGTVSGIYFNKQSYKFWSAINEGGRYFSFNFLWLNKSVPGKTRLIHVYLFGKKLNLWW